MIVPSHFQFFEKRERHFVGFVGYTEY